MKKRYKLSYGGFFRMLISHLFSLMHNLIISFVSFTIWFRCIGEVERICRDSEFAIIFIFGTYRLLGYVVIIGFIVMSFFPKRIIMTQDDIRIKRFYLKFGYYRRGINDKIFIRDIISCKKYTGDRTLPFFNNKPFSVISFDWNDLVEIKTGKFGKHRTYLVPVKNSDEFISEVNLRIVTYQIIDNYNLQPVLSEKGISNAQVKIRWNSQNEVNSIYYTDKKGIDVDIPLSNKEDTGPISDQSGPIRGR